MKFEELKVGNHAVKKVSIDAFESREGFKVTRTCSGKMSGLWAVNTSAKVNPLCQKLSKNPDLICSKCYAQQFLCYRKSCAIRYEKNFHAAAGHLWEYIPDLDSAMDHLVKKLFRIEEFGDIANAVHAANYLLLIASNPTVTFGWWSKHPNLIRDAMELLGLEDTPANLSFVASSPRMNVPAVEYTKWTFVNHVFTVYRGAFAQENDIETNCAASSCYHCQRCYHRGGDFFINEMLKSDHQSPKYRKTADK